MVEWTTKLNTPGEALAEMPDVHALTDVTGFGLAGHLLEICRGSKLSGEVRLGDLPVIEEAIQWLKQGVVTGASDRNWKGYGQDVALPAGAPEWQGEIVTHPQNNGRPLGASRAAGAGGGGG